MFSDMNLDVLNEAAMLFVLTSVPRIILILILVFLARKVMKSLLNRMEVHLSKEKLAADTKRANTLVNILYNIGVFAIYVVSGVLIIQELGFNATPIIASVGILGLAVGFGAQTLVHDIIAGFFILLEDHYVIGDEIQIDNTRGIVESMTIRSTRLRDTDGVVHFIPNSKINKVANLSKDWSGAVLTIDIPYDEDVDRAMDVLRETSKEMVEDKNFGPLITEGFRDPVIENIGNSKVSIRLMARTLPMEQWNVTRELRRRVKKRFDELEIGIK